MALYAESFVAQNALPDDPTPVPLHTTPLDSWHRRHGARMVAFAGYAMPVLYDLTGDLGARCRGGVMAEHLHTRKAAGLFDVSHMGQAFLSGTGVADALEHLVPGDIAGLKPWRQRYTLLTNEAGGIIDDLMVAKLADDRLFVVVNASRKEVDFTHLAANLPDGIAIGVLEGRGLLALQGPQAAAVIARLAPEAARLPFMGFGAVTIQGIDCFVSRSGYTGEDGFEISVPASSAEALADILIGQPEVVPIGLGARDSLAAGGRALPLWQRPRRAHQPGRGGPDLGHRQAPQTELGFPRRPADARPARQRHHTPSCWHPAGRPHAGPGANDHRRR